MTPPAHPAHPVQSEDHILRIISECFGDTAANSAGAPGLILGRGDDCAELAPPSPMAVSTDLFLEAHHFSLRYFSPEQIGAKALAVNLSDLAAAGAVPQGFSMGLMCPRGTDADFLQGVFTGMVAAAREGGVFLSGGDITAAPLLGFSITVWGGPVKEAQGSAAPFLRRNAKDGDAVFVLGQPGLAGAGVGLARLGLERLEADGKAAQESFPAACNALLSPVPLLAAGQALARLNRALAGISGGGRISVMDLSDGLLRDLPRLTASAGTGFDLAVNTADLHPEIQRFFRQNPGSHPDAALALALSGGDEYGLLCAAPPEHLPAITASLNALPQPPSMLVIGRTGGGSGLRINGRSAAKLMPGLAGGGFDHFRNG